MGGVFTQLFPPKPTFTEENAPSLIGKVFIVTGGNAGVGLELIKILYAKGATVYMAGRSPTRIAVEIEAINSMYTESLGQLKSLHVDLGDLTTISTCVSTFLAQESRLDVLWNNAGVTQIPAGSVTAQGHNSNMATNCLGPFLLTKLLLPILIQTAKTSPKDSVRIVFTSSGIVNLNTPSGGYSLADLSPDNHSKDPAHSYGASKVGDWILASEFDKRVRKEGIICVTQSPGTLNTKSWGEVPLLKMLMWPIMHEPKMGAYTELWAGLSPEVNIEDGGKFGIAWGRWHPSPNPDVEKGLKTKEEGGTGLAAEFWDLCEKYTKDYARVGS
jgi:NAD(P)-dependent dehydrogenase (short-subunit alcohol dehydrogenase family)